ncbi:hypothetical protein TRFO_22802 [Tritrichomonas foetus]|uniref:Uncharacterized protein n=1 Tax=Tritrichomonas foetus TaxID=1144522 RepID=A0A1J4KCF1_9EUKA|nr:hypothetical protein TRFO_22802 [Tritrichomonas foetus]|eukprot:OHT08616.1 hypothetical protein TRFO_22802 [Tritrichomonas foetus]
MRNFFRRKNTPASQNNQKPNECDLIFDANHPYLVNGKEFSCDQIKNDPEMSKNFPKLMIWSEKHPETVPLIKIYQFDAQLDNSYHEFRQFALKYQINEGFEQVLKLERSVNDKVETGSAFTEPPFIELTHLVECRRYWQIARQQDFMMQLIKYETNELVHQKLAQLKQTTVHLVSFLGAIDAVPLNCVPLVNFSALVIPREDIINSIPRAIQLEKMAEKYTSLSVESVKKIDQVRSKFDEMPIEAQQEAFKTILKKYHDYFDYESHCIVPATDPSAFYDFITHPHSSLFSSYIEFVRLPNAETFSKLVNSVVDFAGASGNEATIISSLCSLSFAQVMAPNLPNDIITSNDNNSNTTNPNTAAAAATAARDPTNSTTSSNDTNNEQNNTTVNNDEEGIVDEKMIEIGYDILSTADPIMALRVISNHMNAEKSTEESIVYIINCLKLMTSQWKNLLQFIVDCSVQDFLPPKLRSIRYVINQQIVAV